MFNNFRLKRVTYNLGKAVETENDITCAVDNNKLIERLKKHDNHLLLKSKNDPKDITYVITDMNFPPSLKITTDDNIIFINCKFNREVFIDSANKLSFTNNKYNISNNNYIYNDRFLVIKKANIVSFINENFINESHLSYPHDMKIEANKIIIDNSKLYEGYSGHINYKCKDLKIKDNSVLSLRAAYIVSDHIMIDASSIANIKEKCIIESKQPILGIDNIHAKDIILNSIRVKDIDKVQEAIKTKSKIKKI